MLTPEQYQEATSRLRRGERPPNPADIHHLMDMIDEYEAAHKGGAGATEAPPSFGPAALGNTAPSEASAVQEQVLGRPEANEAAQREKEGLPLSIQQAAESVTAGHGGPEIASPPKLSDAEIKKARAHLYDRNLATASQLKSVARPPEFIPPTPVGMAHPLAEALGALPSFAGGKVEHYVEPSEEQFREDMRPVLGDKVDTLDKSSEAYKEYADVQWAKVFDRAQATGTPVVRHAFKDNKSWGAQVSGVLKGQLPSSGEVLNDAVGTVASLAGGAHGADEAAFAGLGGRITGTHENARALMDNAPGASLIGSVLGLTSPNSIGAGAAGAVEGLLPKAAGTMGKILTSGAKGAAAAVADTGARDAAAKAFGDEEGGDESELERLGKSAAAGFGVAATSDALGALLGMHGDQLRRTTPLGEAEKAGVKTSTISGIKPGPRIEELEREGSAAGNTALGHLTSEGAEKIVPAARAASEETKRAIERDVQAYYASDTGKTPHSSAELLDSLLGAHSENVDEYGDLAGDTTNPKFRKLIADTVEPLKVFDSGEAGEELRRAQARNPDARLMHVDDARRMGLDVDTAIARESKELGVSGGLGKDEVLVVPRKFNARQLDRIADNIDAMAIDENGKLVHPAFSRFQKAVRDVRDKFGPGGPVGADRAYALDDGTVVTGWSALKQEHSDLIQETKNALQAGGLHGEPTTRPDVRTGKGAQNALLDYARGGPRNERADESLRELSDKAGVNLDEVRGVGAYEKLKTQAPLKSLLRFRNGEPSEMGHMSLGAVRLRLDPLLSTLAGSGKFGLRGGLPGGLGSLAAPRGRPRATLNPSQAKALGAMLGVTGQF